VISRRMMARRVTCNKMEDESGEGDEAEEFNF
jgi:hypothetical protein